MVWKTRRYAYCEHQQKSAGSLQLAFTSEANQMQNLLFMDLQICNNNSFLKLRQMKFNHLIKYFSILKCYLYDLTFSHDLTAILNREI